MIIIIRGPLGCGKSTISSMLADRLGAKVISMDKVLDDNGLAQSDPALGCIPPESFIKADIIVLDPVLSLLKLGKSVILDGCFYHKEQIEHLRSIMPFPIRIFTLRATIRTCIERDRGRALSYGEGAAIAVHGLVSRFDSGTLIDTDGKSPAQVLEEILRHLLR
jgi:predicted kinase